ncbi:hypothetical protein AB3S75_016028 [Citrus x aurantiifolia]
MVQNDFDIKFSIPISRLSVALLEKIRVALYVQRAALQFIDAAPSEYIATHVPHYFQKAALDFTRSLNDVPSSEYHAKARRFREFVDDIGSAIKGHDLKILKHTYVVFSLRVGNILTYPVLRATSFGVYLLSLLVLGAFSSVWSIFSKFQYYMSLRKYIVTEAAKVRRIQNCVDGVEYVPHNDDDDDDDDS